MHPTVQLSTSLAQAARARALLGAAHPLVRVLELQDVVRRDLLVLAAIDVPVTFAAALGTGAARLILTGIAVTLVALCCAALALRGRRREHPRRLIAEEREQLPIAAVAAERECLLAAAIAGGSLTRWSASGSPQ